MSPLQRIRSQGVLHLAETLFNRIVPASVFRFSVGRVLHLDAERLAEVNTQKDNAEFCLSRVEGEKQRDALRRVTWNSVPLTYAAGDHGYAIVAAGGCQGSDFESKVLGGVWGGVDRFIEADLGFEVQLSPEQAWIYCAYVAKSARGRGVYRRVLAHAAADLVDRGHPQLRVIIQPWNKASMAVHRRYADRIVGTVAVVRVLRWCLVWTTGGVRRDRSVTSRRTENPVKIRVA